ncbi:MAG: DUF1080 domain-containing protein [Alistipes sp.]|nr:DUF1080 domain-containing protein [Alistipes sp.]
MRKFVATLLAVMCCVVCVSAERGGWKSLFNGRNLRGWVKLNGEAEYRIEKGELVGVSTANTPNTFLATEREYGNFILELEYKVEEGVNSGVQIRSHSKPEYKDGRVYGYQCEIDPAAYCGGIYDEARSGWLYSLYDVPQAQTAFKRGEWNKMRVEAVGESVRVWLNGEPTADIVCDKDMSGFIALQVHEIGSRTELVGRTIRWRNIRIKTEGLEKELSPAIESIPQRNHIPNTISSREAAEGWTLLWNGDDLSGWKSVAGKDFKKGWSCKDGVLTISPKSGAGDIITERKFHDFELSIDFKFEKGANSGIKYFIGANGSIGCEFQILDDANHPDANAGFEGNRKLGSLYDILPAEGWKHTRQGDWNTARIVVCGSSVEHWLNGVKILSYERDNAEWDRLISRSKFAKEKNFAAGNNGGHILLQDHNDMVHFRNLKIRELNKK